MLKYIPLMELPLLVVMVLMRSFLLGRHGIKAIVFGVADKTDYIIVPVVLFFFYGMASMFIALPFPAILTKPFWETDMWDICAVVVCTVSLVWFGITLKTFGKSFRVGIDEHTNDALITSGTFGVSRNPIYLAFITFFLGIFLVYANILSAAFLLLLTITIHRQVLREEAFLKAHYGKEYAAYCERVRRYL